MDHGRRGQSGEGPLRRVLRDARPEPKDHHHQHRFVVPRERVRVHQHAGLSTLDFPHSPGAHHQAPDNYGFLQFLADELQECEDNGYRAYVMGHVLSGWDGKLGF